MTLGLSLSGENLTDGGLEGDQSDCAMESPALL